MRALLVQHEPDIPAGYLSDWLDERDIERDVLRVMGEHLEVDPAAYDFVVSLGSWHGAYEDVEWIHREESLLQETQRQDVPILGICFGSQLLAKALGGEAFRRPQPEVGWLKVRTLDEALVPEGPWLVWHFDSFSLPPGAELLADTPDSPQAYSVGHSLGVQFHAELTTETLADWLGKHSIELERNGVNTQRLFDQARERPDAARARALRLFDAFVAWSVSRTDARQLGPSI
ncbi:MAG TPA: type 1 glutamine amidotransferase [Thermoleophilaceae bacterium]|nr:type 1 glutamine amidotransferase [Thermoleophilaceae bacterium]